MSTAMVDLLPPEIAVRRRDRRLVVWTALGVAAFVGVLGGSYAYQISTVDSARLERDEGGRRRVERRNLLHGF